MTLPDRHWRYVTVRVYDLGDVVLPFGARLAGGPQYQHDERGEGCWLVGYWEATGHSWNAPPASGGTFNAAGIA